MTPERAFNPDFLDMFRCLSEARAGFALGLPPR